MEVRFARNLSSTDDIRLHLTACSPSFVPPLDSRVAIPDYSAKLALRAERFEAWTDDRLVGLVALYCPAASQPDSSDAFVSNVSVLPSFTRRSIAKSLLLEAIAYARRCSGGIVLEVDHRAAALGLYCDCDFVTVARHGGTLTLRLDLRQVVGRCRAPRRDSRSRWGE